MEKERTVGIIGHCDTGKSAALSLAMIAANKTLPVIKLKKTNLWECPECGYLVSEIEYFQARISFQCPRCDKSEFQYFHISKKKFNEEQKGTDHDK